MKSGNKTSPRQRLQSSGFRNSPKTTGPVFLQENLGKLPESRPTENIQRKNEHRVDIQDEQSELLEYEVVSGKLILDSRNSDCCCPIPLPYFMKAANQDGVEANLTRKELAWGSDILQLDDVVSVSYSSGQTHFTVHTYLVKRRFCCWRNTRIRTDFCFLASSPEEAYMWVSGFAFHDCFLNRVAVTSNSPPMPNIKCKSPLKLLVILNPRSGNGHSSKVFHDTVEPIFKLAGFQLRVVKTESAGHAKNLVATIDFNTCPDGIICIGGDGIVNEVLNGLLIRKDQKEALSIPMGIIPAGSDNSLVWTVLGENDPASAAVAIVKGGLVATDVLVVEWVQSGLIQFGMTVSYFGFVSDALELSEKYQKHLGPLRYIVAGIQKFLCLPKYNFEVEYLPIKTDQHENVSADHRELENLRTIPRTSTETTMIPPTVGDEPSDYDPKSKCCSSSSSSGGGRKRNVWEEAEVIHPQTPRSAKARSWLKAGKGTDNKGESSVSNRSDPGPVWENQQQPTRDLEANWNKNDQNPIDLPPTFEIVECEDDETREGDVGRRLMQQQQQQQEEEENWMRARGEFLGILICNHSCKTVQSGSQMVAPHAKHDDKCLDLMMIRGSGRFRLLRFFILMHLGRHLSLPYVEYVKVQSVKLKQANNTKTGCGIDGELVPVNGQVVTSLYHAQCLLIGRHPNS
ncbi:sphingoid long-chain bases kinase 1-like [Impatiens glandulifera]|uniref:sphingoid long-chain bases kinase 1-like n=1 Tax=Impatiens glandulifera TaxID=253017 RepID=UPI001FB09FBA|nr:sphingoid long-chain bases kinase 1-like [Impatiens glandulifera]